MVDFKKSKHRSIPNYLKNIERPHTISDAFADLTPNKWRHSNDIL